MRFEIPAASLVLALLAFGCTVVDSSLVDELRPADAGADGGNVQGDGGTDGGGGIQVDTCVNPEKLKLVTRSNTTFSIDTSGLQDDLSGFSNCLGTDAPGKDGFFAVQATAGQVWHVHITPRNGSSDPVQNPVLYALRTCDDRQCRQGFGLNLCGDGEDEHFSFKADSAGLWIVGVDDTHTGGGKYDILVVSPVCGDGTLIHNEVCDPMLDGADCGTDCRWILDRGSADGDLEKEPNDDWTVANRIELNGTPSRVRGTVGGLCDIDYYAVLVGDNGSLQADLREPGGAASCTELPADVDGVALTLVDADGRTVIQTNKADPGGACPVLSRNNMPAGLYFIRVEGQEATEANPTAASFAYDLVVEVSQ